MDFWFFFYRRLSVWFGFIERKERKKESRPVTLKKKKEVPVS
jgi:hypothetical protein